MNDEAMHLIWYEADEKANPFGIRILDCYQKIQSWTAVSQDHEVITIFHKLRKSKGIEYKEKYPEDNVVISCKLKYPCRGMKTGPLYESPSMDYKWNIYHYTDFFYFVRSWTGELIHTAAIELFEGYLIIHQLWSKNIEKEPNIEERSIREVDFLIKSHLYNAFVPHPITQEVAKLKPEAIAHLSFSLYGKKALYASPDDTTQFTYENFLDFIKKNINHNSTEKIVE